MTPNNPAPRPCTLWGSTFEANHVTSYSVRAIDDFDIIPASRMFQARITVGAEQRVYAPNQHESRFDAHRDMQEAVNLVNQALHPPLCMKHALEIGYEFRQLGELVDKVPTQYILGAKGQDPVLTWLKWDHNGESLIDLEQKNPLAYYDWFKPADSEGNPTHGNAEAVVNVWKEGE